MAVTHGSAGDRLYWNTRGLRLLWWGLLAGPLAFALDLTIGYALVKPACAAGSRLPLYLMTMTAALVTASGLWTAWRCHAMVRCEGRLEGARVVDRSAFLARLGIVLSVFFLLLVLATLVPRAALDPCE